MLSKEIFGIRIHNFAKSEFPATKFPDFLDEFPGFSMSLEALCYVREKSSWYLIVKSAVMNL